MRYTRHPLYPNPVDSDSSGAGTGIAIPIVTHDGLEPGSPPFFSPVVTEDGKPVVYFFFNRNCGECLKTLPLVEKFANDNPSVKVV